MKRSASTVRDEPHCRASPSMLQRGNTNMATIAAEIGYESEAAFSRAFKKMMGVPPSAWRQGMR